MWGQIGNYLFWIVLIIIAIGILYYLYQRFIKIDNQLNKISKTQQSLQTQVAHGVLLDPHPMDPDADGKCAINIRLKPGSTGGSETDITSDISSEGEIQFPHENGEFLHANSAMALLTRTASLTGTASPNSDSRIEPQSHQDLELPFSNMSILRNDLPDGGNKIEYPIEEDNGSLEAVDDLIDVEDPESPDYQQNPIRNQSADEVSLAEPIPEQVIPVVPLVKPQSPHPMPEQVIPVVPLQVTPEVPLTDPNPEISQTEPKKIKININKKIKQQEDPVNRESVIVEPNMIAEIPAIEEGLKKGSIQEAIEQEVQTEVIERIVKKPKIVVKAKEGAVLSLDNPEDGVDLDNNENESEADTYKSVRFGKPVGLADNFEVGFKAPSSSDPSKLFIIRLDKNGKKKWYRTK